jgi:hypothetical protein
MTRHTGYHGCVVDPHLLEVQELQSSGADPHHLDADPDPACNFGADPDPIFHFDADPDSSFQIKVQNFWLVICKSGYHFDADPDPTFQFDVDPCGSGSCL